MRRARDKLYLMQQTMAGAGETAADVPAGEAGETHAAPASSKVSRAEVIHMLQFGVAGALAAQQEGETGVTPPLVRAMLDEVARGAAARQPQVTVGIGGRRPLDAGQASGSGGGGMDAAAASAALGTSEELEARTFLDLS